MPVPVLVFRVGSRLGGLQLACVSETMRPLDVETLPGMPEPVVGAAIIRGEPVPVVDLGRVLSGERLETPERLVTLRLSAGRSVALLVSAVLGIRQLDALDEAPPLLRDAAGGAIDALARLDAELLTVLRQGALVPDDLWEKIDLRGERSDRTD